MITVKAAASRAGVSRSLIYQLVRTGRLKHYRIGARGRGKILIDEKDLEVFVASCQVAAPEEVDEEEQLTFLK